MAKLEVLNTQISVVQDEYISLTDIAKYKNPQDANEIIRNWLRNRNTIEFLGIWEKIHNDKFNPIEFDGFRKEAGLNSFTLSTQKWVESTNAIGLISKAGRYGGTYAHISYVYASEADILNVALFGMTAKQWSEANPDLKGNIRDYADVYQLVCLANLESLNAHFINENIPQDKRIQKLNGVAIKQMSILLSDDNIKKLESK